MTALPAQVVAQSTKRSVRHGVRTLHDPLDWRWPRLKRVRMPPGPKIRQLAAGLIILLMVGCATSGGAPEWGTFKSSVEALYLNYWELKRLHQDLHHVALAHLEASGPHLAEIQSAARFIHHANTIAYYQWELLSITAYIRESAQRDFFTLRARDLIDARDKSKDLILSTRVYEAFIRDPQALELIHACIVHIEKHRTLYLQMAQELERFNQGARATAASNDKALTLPSHSYKSGNSKGSSGT